MESSYINNKSKDIQRSAFSNYPEIHVNQTLELYPLQDDKIGKPNICIKSCKVLLFRSSFTIVFKIYILYVITPDLHHIIHALIPLTK